MPDKGASTQYPTGLLAWAGNRAGGVRRPFDESSGRPGGQVFQTNLLELLRRWCEGVGSGLPTTPRLLLLVGGPGNGKTEAIETSMGWLDAALNCNGALVSELARGFRPNAGKVPRNVYVDAGTLARPSREGLQLHIVQDASVVAGSTNKSAAHLLLDEIEAAHSPDAKTMYLCCVNRGVLDDALIAATESGKHKLRELLEKVTHAVSLLPDAPSCWPLKDEPAIAVWPMDMESLMTATSDGSPPPAQQVLHNAIAPNLWPQHGACDAGPKCPFCTSREQLSHDREQQSLLSMLRWYELGTGKRWSFRDIFSLFSYMLSGYRHEARDSDLSPCSWAATQFDADSKTTRNSKPTIKTSSAIFALVTSQYHHALFHTWDWDAGRALQKDIKDLGLEDDHTAMGLQWFLNSRRSPYLPAMIEGSLRSFSELLDPALALPDTSVIISRSTSYILRDIDTRFSRSVSEGLGHVRKSRILTPLEIDLLERLAQLDEKLAQQSIRKKRPTTATRAQRLLRDFSCRLVRRSIGTRTQTVLDSNILQDFQRVVDDKSEDAAYDVAREIELLINTEQEFEVSLTTTFGQPLPPSNIRSMLVVPRRNVQASRMCELGRPAPPLRFLQIGDGSSAQDVALTYDLFKAVKDIKRGMSSSSLPRSVLALLDTTRARLAGPIVRDKAVLSRATISLGGQVTIEQRRNGFGVVGGRTKQ